MGELGLMGGYRRHAPPHSPERRPGQEVAPRGSSPAKSAMKTPSRLTCEAHTGHDGGTGGWLRRVTLCAEMSFSSLSVVFWDFLHLDSDKSILSLCWKGIHKGGRQ